MEYIWSFYDPGANTGFRSGGCEILKKEIIQKRERNGNFLGRTRAKKIVFNGFFLDFIQMFLRKRGKWAFFPFFILMFLRKGETNGDAPPSRIPPVSFFNLYWWMFREILIPLLLLFLILIAQQCSAMKVGPIDEGSARSSFLKFNPSLSILDWSDRRLIR